MPPVTPQPATLDPPATVRQIAEKLERAGFETWCVGGAVRDALLGRLHLDWDLATAATPEQVQALFRRTVPVGIDFGTVAVLDRTGRRHEVTTFRRDVRTDGRHAIVEYGVSLDEDLSRRDFTINAIAFSPRTGAIHDPFDGQKDLSRGVVRAVGTPAARMREDRLRALRALRFASRFGFAIDPETWAAIVESAPELPRLSRERVRQELEKTMDQVACPSTALELWRRSGALQSLIPELATQPAATFRAADAIGAPSATAREALSSSRRRNRLTTLFLDLGGDGAGTAARALRFSNRDVDWFSHAADCWHDLDEPMRRTLIAGPAPNDGQLRRWAARTGRTRFRDVFRVMNARWWGDRQPEPHLSAPRSAPDLSAPRSAPDLSAPRVLSARSPDARAAARAYRRGLRIAFRDPIELPDLAVDGGDLQELGVAPGPHLGGLLRQLLDRVLDDPALNRRDTLLAEARQLLEPGDNADGRR